VARPQHAPLGELAARRVEAVSVSVAAVVNIHVEGRVLRVTAGHLFWQEKEDAANRVRHGICASTNTSVHSCALIRRSA